MRELAHVLADLASRLEAREVPYMVIGGMANAVWGVPRATVDIDVTVILEPKGVPHLVKALAPSYRPRTSHPEKFAADTRVLPLRHVDDIEVDLVLAMLPFEEEAVRHAVAVDIAGTAVRFCTAEDLVLLKIVSQRDRDRKDVEALLRRRRGRIDRSYLDPRIHELATLLERPELERRYVEALEE